ncbi:MAG: hypothetical protein ABIZ04_03905 [Opitutus sp.]
MRRLLKVFGLLSLALWLPMTLHCDLEAAGLIPVGCEPDAHGSETTGATDSCDLVESDSYKPATFARVVSAPALVPDVFNVSDVLVPSEQSADPGRVSWKSDVAPIWVSTWQFERRTALPSRAPSLV